MRFTTLKSKEDFLKWKEIYLRSGGVSEDPEEYPCLAGTYVSSCIMEEETAEYLYKADIEIMLKEVCNEKHS